MARKLSEIKQEILDQKAQQPELAGLNSSSSEAIWMLWVNLTAYIIWLQENLWDAHKVEVDLIAGRAVPGTVRWYQYIALQYQEGYSLEWNAEKLQYEYPVIDEAAKIVKRSSVREFGGIVQLKFAKLDADDKPEPLDAAEKAAFNSYMYKVKFAGTFLQEISEPSDLLKLNIDVYYDPIRIIVNVQSAVELAINNYISDLPFDSELRLSKIVDEIQLVDGVVDVANLVAEAKHGTLNYSPISVAYVTFAGHMKIDPAFPLSSTINYIPDPQY